MTVGEDVTLLWSDDNRGNIRRIPIGTESSRRGGAGMYYHFDYVGSPRNWYVSPSCSYPLSAVSGALRSNFAPELLPSLPNHRIIG